MTHYDINFPEPDAPGRFPPYAAIVKVLELVATQEDAVGPDDEEHAITFLTSMAPEVVNLRLMHAHYRNRNFTTQHIVCRWENAGFVQYLLWDSTKQDIVDMVEA